MFPQTIKAFHYIWATPDWHVYRGLYTITEQFAAPINAYGTESRFRFVGVVAKEFIDGKNFDISSREALIHSYSEWYNQQPRDVKIKYKNTGIRC